jgi:hypothetical protein
MRLPLSAALLALTAATAHGQTVGGNAYGVALSSPLVAVDETPFVALPASGGVMILSEKALAVPVDLARWPLRIRQTIRVGDVCATATIQCRPRRGGRILLCTSS